MEIFKTILLVILVTIVYVGIIEYVAWRIAVNLKKLKENN